MISDNTDTSCNDAGGIGRGYMSITRAEGIEHGCVNVEQQPLLGQQSATAKVCNEVREKSSASETPRSKKKSRLDKGGEQKVMECYLRSKPKKQ